MNRRIGVALCGLVLALWCSAIPAPANGIEVIANLDYAGDELQAHRLDLYLPANRTSAAIVVFVHGGAFMEGDRSDVAFVGRALAGEGIATVVVSYRLFPQSNAEGATQDVARAIAWTVAHARDYGLDANKLFLAGHSAGAQIVAIIGTNPRYLNAAGLSMQAVRGVFAVAGAYDVRDLSGEPDTWQRVDDHIYGETPEARRALSPAVSIDAQSRPTVTACGTQDDPWSCDRALSFSAALRRRGIDSATIEEHGADHIGMLRALADPRDPLNEALLHFIGVETAPADH